MAGRIINFHPPGPSPLKPDVGNRPNCTDTTRISIRANQNSGTEITANESTLTTRSTTPRGRLAANIPNGIPKEPIAHAITAKIAVLGRRVEVYDPSGHRIVSSGYG